MLSEKTLTFDEGEKIYVQYVPVNQVVLWEDNPKKHDFGALIQSISEYGFRDPPAWDAKLGALVEGNGRAHALQLMQSDELPVPRGILTERDTGEWCMPIIFGVDSESETIAARYAIDHNNLVLAGGEFSVFETARMWDMSKYVEVLRDTTMEGDLPITIDSDDLYILMTGVENEDNPEHGDPIENEELYPKITLKVKAGLVEDIADEVKKVLRSNVDWDVEIKY